MNLKLNWGTGIVIVYMVFVAGMLGLVYLCTQQHYDLVSPDYYEKELNYQQVIDGSRNAAGNNNAAMRLTVTGDTTHIRISNVELAEKGKVFFYRPDNAAFDVQTDLLPDGTAALASASMRPGLYVIKASWKQHGKPFYLQKNYTHPR